MNCCKCNQPMVVDDGRTQRMTYHAPVCLDCRGNMGARPVVELDTYEYIRQCGISRRLRDAALFYQGVEA